MQQLCLFCGNLVINVHVHGHYQCPVCHTNALPCCDGDNCETNMILRNPDETVELKDINNKLQTCLTGRQASNIKPSQ